MGAWVLKRQRSPLGLSVIVFLFLGLANHSVLHCQGTNLYWPRDLYLLQELFVAWSATPDITSNLDGWNVSQPYPCPNLHSSADATIPNWRGVQCLPHNTNVTADTTDVDIVGLSLSNASITGMLPSNISNFHWLVTLELTGNPNLTGPLPKSLGNMWLNVLDIHDNGFYGNIPNLTLLFNVLRLGFLSSYSNDSSPTADLSGNAFTGEYPYPQFSTMDYLQEFSIGNNRFEGEIPSYAFTNKTEVQKLDISDNHFNGSLPSLEKMRKLIYLDVSGNKFTGALPDLRAMHTLRTVNLGRNQFTGWTGNLSSFLNLSSKLTTVDLSSNKLSGPLPMWTSSSLGTIRELYLQNNSLSGTLDIVAMYRQGLLQLNTNASADKLWMMSLSNNSIRRVNYDAFAIENVTTVFKLDGNPYCERYDAGNDGQRCFCNQICFVTPAKNNRKIIIIAVVSSLLAVIFIVGAVVGALLYKNRRYKQYLQIQFSKRFEEYDVKPTIFSYNELRVATRDFHDDVKLGQGGYGAVYKGVLPNGNVVAVKQLFIKKAQGLDEFSNEIVLITGMKHRNLVNLKGCCLRETQRLLVYEYVDNFDVDQILLGARRQVVSWHVRQKICLGVARGLHYLHALAHPRVIHRDIKASNVLLDKNMEPKIADFGLALLFPDEQSHIMTIHVAGTKGYLAPEYASLGQLSDKVDVYSFGVLCLEIISGRRNIDESYSLEQVYLSKWAWLLHEQNRLLDLIDSTLQLRDDDVRDVLRVINLCLLCIHNSPEKRPTMARIVSILQSDTESEVVVLGEGKGEPMYRPGNGRSHSRSVDFYHDNGLESVREEGGSSGSYGYYGRQSQPGSGPEGLSVGVELSGITAR